MRAVDIIRKKRDGEILDEAEIQFFVSQATSGAIPAYQVSAFLMAVVWRGMSVSETQWLAFAMAASGTHLDLPGHIGHRVDKHSTGGVGDKTSPILVPLVAACGAIVPMTSGRSLGYTGGTLDKLESIPGFRTALSPDEIRVMLDRYGCCMVGQTDSIAPADRLLYGLRDVTATVESVPLIAASIMSKKLAVDLDGLVLDVTMGRGAFMKSPSDARELAERLVAIGTEVRLPTRVLMTSMDAPRGHAVGNAVEIIECVKTLKGQGPSDLERLVVSLAAEMVHLAGLESTLEASEQRVSGVLASGKGLEQFQQVITAQGGDPRIIDDYRLLPVAAHRQMIKASRNGYLVQLDAELVARATIVLGAGRDRVDVEIDPAVGVVTQVSLGDEIRSGDPLAEIHYQRSEDLPEAIQFLKQAIVIADAPPKLGPVVLERVA